MYIRRQISDFKVIFLCSQVSPLDLSTEVSYQVLKLSFKKKGSGETVSVVLVNCVLSLFNLRPSVFQYHRWSQCLRNPLTPQQREEKRWHFPAGPQALLSPPSPGTGRLCIHTPLPCIHGQASGKILTILSFCLEGNHYFWISFETWWGFCFQFSWLNCWREQHSDLIQVKGCFHSSGQSV